MTRYEELMDCFRTAVEQHCTIIDDNTTWEGLRWTETHENGDSITLGGMTVPLSTQFLVCENHVPEEER